MNTNQEVPKWQQMQEHTFTVWLNERLQPQGLVINDLYDDLDDGVMLIQLLNILFNTEVTKNYNRTCRMKIQKMENLKISFNYLEKVRKLKLVNLGPSDVVDHNKKMVLALIFNIIHHIQIESIKIDGLSGKQGLLLWVKRHVEPLGVKVNDFAQSWKDGRAFSALTSVFTSLDFNESERQSVSDRLNNAFDVAHDELKVPKLLQASDIMESNEIDEHSVLTYISSFFSRCANQDQTKKYTDIIRTAVDISAKHSENIQKYEEGIKALSKWLNEMITIFSTSVEGKSSTELYPLIDQLQKYRKHEKPEKLSNKVDLEGILNSVQNSQKSNNRKVYTPITAYSIATINKLFQDMSSKEITYEKAIMNELKKMVNSEVNIRKIERQLDIIEPFYNSQQDLYKNVVPCKNLYVCMMKLQHVDNFNSVSEVIDNEYTLMMNLYQSINKDDSNVKNIQSRVSAVTKVRDSVNQLKQTYVQYYTEQIRVFQHLDELLQTLISELYSITVYVDIYSDEIQEPVIMDDINGDVENSNIQVLTEKITALKKRMDDLKPIYDELSQNNYLDASNPYQYQSLYDDINNLLNECNTKFEENKNDIENQHNIDSIQKEFSEACNNVKEYINECNVYISEGDIYEQKQRVEETLIEFNSTPGVFKHVEEINDICQQNNIKRNPYTSETIYTITALKEEYIRLLKRIENSLNVCILEREKEDLTPEQKQTIEDVFNYFDKDHKGYITLDGFYQSIKAIGLNMTAPECNEALVQHNIEVNENTHVPIEVLHDVMLAQLHSAITKETILDAYQHLSNNKDTISDVTLTKYFGNEPCYTYMTSHMREKGGLYDYKRFADELFNY